MQPFNASLWDVVDESFTDITCHRSKHQGVIRIAIDRPACRNAFRPQTVDELLSALRYAQAASDVGCVLLTGGHPQRMVAGLSSVVTAGSGRMGTSMMAHHRVGIAHIRCSA